MSVERHMEESRSGEKLQNAIRRKTSPFFIGVLLVSGALILVGAMFDLTELKSSFYDFVKYVLMQISGETQYDAALLFVSNAKQAVSGRDQDFCTLAYTTNTILAAVVVLSYSLLDNRRAGITYRTIMSYTFGTYMVPVLFLLTVCLMPMLILFQALSTRWTLWMSLLVIYGIQVLILTAVLLSTSQWFAVRAVITAECRQYRYLSAITISEEKYIWTYLVNHMEQVIISEEPEADKMLLVRKLLWVPFGDCTAFYGFKINDTLLTERKIHQIYEYYYLSLLAVCNRLRENIEGRDKLFKTLYYFLNKIYFKYTGLKKRCENEERGRLEENCLMIFSAVLNAVLTSRAEEAEGFCIYILNNYLLDTDLRRKQIGLYFLFQEFLYRMDEQAIVLNHIEGIEGISEWTAGTETALYLYGKFWDIWARQITISSKAAQQYFGEAISALEGGQAGENPLSFIHIKIKQMREEYI